MKLVSVNVDGQNRIGCLVQGAANKTTELLNCLVLDPADGWPVDMKCLIESTELMSRLEAIDATSSNSMPLEQVKILAPVTGVEKLICIGTNYADHAREMGGDPPEIPVVFNKFPSTINHPGGEVRLPKISNQVDFEAELVVVIGRSGKNISRANAMDHVFGYCCGIDVSARDWQKGKPGGQWLLGKTFDTFAPLGPAIVTKDEIPNPQQLDIQLRLNGQVMQDSNTNQLIFPVDHLIAHLSQFSTLNPGDLIFTGTPSGVGAGRNPPIFLQPGDHLAVEIQGLGILESSMVADS